MLFLFILQNAYRSEKYNFRNDQEWHRDLLRSHTGRRLHEMLPDGITMRVINSSPLIGDTADACFRPSIKHIKKQIKKIKPDVICACGNVAQQGCKELGIEFISLPHPAWRQLSKKKTSEIKSLLERYI